MDIRITIPDEKKNDLALKRMDLLERTVATEGQGWNYEYAGV